MKSIFLYFFDKGTANSV